MLHTRFLTIPALLFAGCVQISGTIEEACIHKSGLAIEAVSLPEGLDQPLMSAIEQEFVHENFDTLEPLLNSGLDTEVYFTGATLHAVGVDDLSFVRSIELRGTADPRAALPALELGSCENGNCTSGQDAYLTADGGEDHDVMEYLETGSLKFRMTVTGELPPAEWAMDVDICLRGTVSYELGL